jgi:aminoglycoside phosphotransferase (APT) family kinase protein
MTEPWSAEQVVDAGRAASLVGEQFPELRGAPVRELAVGWDNSVVLVGEVLFRFPRREVAVALQDREVAVLSRIAGTVPLPVPEPSHLGRPSGDYPWPFWGAPMLPGEELAVLPPQDPTAAAEAAGEFLRVLHGLTQQVAVDVTLPTDPNGRATPAGREQRTRGWLDSLRARGIWSGSVEVDALVDCGLGPPSGPLVLVHGDLHLRHLLVDPAGRATGVIDWGDTCWAHPALDLSLAYAAFTGRARAAMLDAYGPVDADTETRGRVLAVSLCAALADWASSTGDAERLPEMLRGLERAVS